ncbi:MAG: glycosyltransferase [Bacteroidales bacterium]|jgi:alpha-1,3-rhamnosyltransferase|nr:glycosyltransferase [Bacteroidales bacterium]
MFFSVVITTYNAERFLLDALNSLKSQTFQDFEWIITDDASTDHTRQIYRQWLADNPEFATRLKIIESKTNTGISANVNRGLRAASGDWIHVLSADDALFEDTLEQVCKFVKNNSDISVLQGISAIYNTDFADANLAGYLSENYKTSDFFQRSSGKQYRYLLKHCHVVAPAVFFKKDAVEHVGFCDESIPMIDDWPLWLKLTKADYKFYFLNRVVVKYRYHNKSFVNENKGLLIDDVHRKARPVYDLYIAPNIGIFGKIKYHTTYLFKEILYRFFNSKENPIAAFMLAIWRIFRQSFVKVKN